MTQRRLFTRRQRSALRLVAGNRCESCGKALDAMHADHIKPHSKGGATTLSNAQALCPRCNLTKGNQ